MKTQYFLMFLGSRWHCGPVKNVLERWNKHHGAVHRSESQQALCVLYFIWIFNSLENVSLRTEVANNLAFAKFYIACIQTLCTYSMVV